MPDEARLEDVGNGLAPVTAGWFVVNARDAAWAENPSFGWRCVFESSPRVLQERDDVEPQMFSQVGYTLAVLKAGSPTGLYHSETAQEDFFVLQGTCLLLVAGEERQLQRWDFFHCPAGTEHTFVGVSDDPPCVIFMTGARIEGKTLNYPREDVAVDHGAAAEQATSSPREAYAPHGHWRLGRPDPSGLL